MIEEVHAYIRDYAMYAAVFGMFAFAWFGWAQENPPKSWPIFLGIGSIISLLITGVGVYLAIKNWGAASSLAEAGAYAKFGIVVATEIGSMLVGSLVLALSGKASYISLWISFVVVVHFIPLATIFKDAWLFGLAGLLIVGQITALLYANARHITLSALVGVITGVILVCYALRGLVLFFVKQP